MWANGIIQANTIIGKTLGEFSNDYSRSYVNLSELGAIAYYSRWSVPVDHGRLVDRDWPLNLPEETIRDHVFEKMPDAIIYSSSNVLGIDSTSLPSYLGHDSRFSKYVLAGKFVSHQPGTTTKKGGIGFAIYVFVKQTLELEPLIAELRRRQSIGLDFFQVDQLSQPW